MCPYVPDRIGICWFLSWGQNRSPGEKPLRARERTTTNSTHKRCGSRDLNPGDIDGGWVLSPLYHPCSPCFHTWWNTPRFCLLNFNSESFSLQVISYKHETPFFITTANTSKMARRGISNSGLVRFMFSTTLLVIWWVIDPRGTWKISFGEFHTEGLSS